MQRSTQTTTRRISSGPAFLAVALFCAGLCLSCSDDPSVDVSFQCLEFVPDEGTASGHVITRTGAESTCNFLDLEFVVTDLSAIRSTEIQIRYPASLAFFLYAEAGPLLLGSGSTAVSCDEALSEYDVDCRVTHDFENGTVDLSISRTPETPGGVDAPAEGAVLAIFTFQQITTLSGANGPFDFIFGKLLDDGEPPANIIDVATDPSSFVGGQMVIVQQ